jgi:hypothetical protein
MIVKEDIVILRSIDEMITYLESNLKNVQAYDFYLLYAEIYRKTNLLDIQRKLGIEVLETRPMSVQSKAPKFTRKPEEIKKEEKPKLPEDRFQFKRNSTFSITGGRPLSKLSNRSSAIDQPLSKFAGIKEEEDDEEETKSIQQVAIPTEKDEMIKNATTIQKPKIAKPEDDLLTGYSDD